MNIILKGVEVTLRPLARTDAQQLAAAAAESREHYRLAGVPDGIESARRYIEQALSRPDRMPFAIEWRGRIAGSTSYLDLQTWQWPDGCAMQRVDRPDVLEIGATWLAESAQRTRCNTESKFLLLRYAFEAFEVHRVTLRTDARNERSRRAIERLGAAFEGIRRADKPATDCTVRDSAFYSIIRGEWEGVKGRLEGMLKRSE